MKKTAGSILTLRNRIVIQIPSLLFSPEPVLYWNYPFQNQQRPSTLAKANGQVSVLFNTICQQHATLLTSHFNLAPQNTARSWLSISFSLSSVGNSASLQVPKCPFSPQISSLWSLTVSRSAILKCFGLRTPLHF